MVDGRRGRQRWPAVGYIWSPGKSARDHLLPENAIPQRLDEFGRGSYERSGNRD